MDRLESIAMALSQSPRVPPSVEDVRWMIREIRMLRAELERLKVQK